MRALDYALRALDSPPPQLPWPLRRHLYASGGAAIQLARKYINIATAVVAFACRDMPVKRPATAKLLVRRENQKSNADAH